MVREDVKVLVVDDVNTMRVQIKHLLESFGFKNVAVAEHGEAAKVAIAATRFDLILSDWHMSPLDGLELLKHIRTQSSIKDVAFIMVTAESTKEKVIEAIKGGVDDYLIKPLTLEQIETKVTSVLVKKQVLK